MVERLNRIEIFFIINFIMLGVVMYWTGIVVQPTYDIAKTQQKQIQIAINQNDLAINQNNRIIDNQNNNTKVLQATLLQNKEIIEVGTNNTALLVELFERQNKLLTNQIMLVTKVANATNVIQNASDSINNQVGQVVKQSAALTQMIQDFRGNFSEILYQNQTIAGDEIIDEVKGIGDQQRSLRAEIIELIKLTLNRTTSGPNLSLDGK